MDAFVAEDRVQKPGSVCEAGRRRNIGGSRASRSRSLLDVLPLRAPERPCKVSLSEPYCSSLHWLFISLTVIYRLNDPDELEKRQNLGEAVHSKTLVFWHFQLVDDETVKGSTSMFSPTVDEPLQELFNVSVLGSLPTFVILLQRVILFCCYGKDRPRLRRDEHDGLRLPLAISVPS